MSSIPQLFQQAMMVHRLGRLDQASAIYQQILRLDPRHFEAMHLLGVIAHQLGNNSVAVDHIQRALRLHPDFPAARSNLGLALTALGRTDDAIASLQEAIRLQPNMADAHNGLGAALTNAGKFDEAMASLREALRLQPLFPQAYNNLGNVLRLQNKLDEAIAHYRQALSQWPEYADVYNNLGNVLGEQGNLDEAIAHYRQCLRLRPNFAPAHSNLGNALLAQGKFDEAIASYQDALRAQPDFAEPCSNTGNALIAQGKLDEAIATYKKALLLKADHADAHFNLALMHLMHGRFVEGWAAYEWRWKANVALPHGATSQQILIHQWDGAPLEGRSIRVHTEQGLGDTIQFVRYLPFLKERGAGRIWLVVQPNLLRLLNNNPHCEIVAADAPLPDADVACPLLTLPRLLGTNAVENIPAQVPYLACDTDLIARWDKRLTELSAARPLLRVGIVWQGYAGHKADQRRSVRLTQFAPLADLPGLRLISLQKGSGAEQLEQSPGLAIDLGPELIDMTDTAAVIRCLDLVISIDTSVAHLAGALAAPVWLAIAKVPDWRWLLDRDDSPWYPTMRLFRQTTLGEWGDVFRRIKDALMVLRSAV